MRKFLLVAAVTATAIGLAPVVAGTASASPRGCSTNNEYSFTGIAAGDFNPSGYHATNGPGGTVTDTVMAGYSFSSTRTRSGGSGLSDTIGAFTAAFHSETGRSVQATYTASSQESGSHVIDRGYIGTETWGNYGYYNNWEYGHDTADCRSYVVVSYGHSVIDTPGDGFHFTEVRAR